MDELEKIAPELSKIKNGSPFRAPDNYFDNFSDRLSKRIGEERAGHSTAGKQIIHLIKPALKVAASIAFIAMLVYSAMTYLLPGAFKRQPGNEVALTEEERISSFIENVDENSFFALIQETEPVISEEEQFDNEELLSYLCCNISEYEIYLENDN